jgi:hypothetical protein
MRGLRSSEVDSLHPLASDYRWSLQQNPFLRGAGIRRHPARADGECVGALQRLCALFETGTVKPELLVKDHITPESMPTAGTFFPLECLIALHHTSSKISATWGATRDQAPLYPGVHAAAMHFHMPPDSYERSYWIPGAYAPALSEKCNSFLRLLKNKGFKEERMTKVGLYAIGKSTTLESNKSPFRNASSVRDNNFSTSRSVELGRSKSA